MKLVPSEISSRTPSAAEKKVFQLLRHVSMEGYVALHSLALSEHRYKKCGEIDFLLVGPSGIFVLEVKGGRVARNDGVWTFTDRHGQARRKAEGPFQQAKSAAFSLRDRLRLMSTGAKLPDFCLGWGVVLPDQEFTEESVEWAQQMVLDADDCVTAMALERGLKRLIHYWTAKNPSRPLPEDDLAILKRTLRPDFDQVLSLRLRGEQADEALQSLTESQYKVLDMVDGNERILCEGGAGTGKSFLAAEVARREAISGRSVLLTCRSQILARFLAGQPGLKELGCEVADLATVSRSAHSFDVLVVDEGQDVMNIDDLSLLDAKLQGGLASGRWRVFYDSNNQSGILGSFDETAFDLLRDSGSSRLHLPDNCRNTRDIVTQVQLVTGADVGVSSAGAGVPVAFLFWETEEEEAGLLAVHLNALLDGGVEPGHITILSGIPFEKSCIRLLPDDLRSRILVLDSAMAGKEVHGIGFSSVRDFKGLENRFVCVVDVTSIKDDDGTMKTLYVAMTRPRAGLWIGLERGLRAELRNSRKDVLSQADGGGASNG